jgi:hypothetical protein
MTTMETQRTGRPGNGAGMRPPRSGARTALVVAGVLLMLGGAGWLLDSAGVVSLPVTALLAVALAGVGVVLMLDAGRHAHGGLIALGAVLTVVLALSAAVGRLDIDPAAGVGDRTVAPVTVAELTRPQELGTGTLTVDLRGVALPRGETAVTARVGAGRLVVRVPAGVPFQVRGRAAVGAISVLGRVESGMDLDITVTNQADGDGYATAPTRLRLDLRIGTGQIEVLR